MKIKRSCGVLLPVYSLPSKYGIGTLGKAAYDFIDFLHDAGQSWWQMLPLGPTSYGDSPYQSFSAFAGNPYLIDLDMLKDAGLLTSTEISSFDYGTDKNSVNYSKMYESRFKVLKLAKERGLSDAPSNSENVSKFFEFVNENREWLPDYALFMAVKAHFSMKAWTEWGDEGIKLRRDDSLGYYHELLKDDIKFYEYLQYLFFMQWNKLKEYAKDKGIGIIGDLPIYVSMDSADVWANKRCFLLDEEGKATEVAGVPPDYFSADGQLWGNPLYNWDYMKNDGYGWWIRRIAGASKLYDVLRIDHFRGFESFWAIPADAKTAKDGRWVKAPGMDFVRVITSWFSDIQFIAEDLGYLTPEVKQLVKDSGLPGMKVLEFAFDSREPSNYLPHTYEENCVCYIGTHDNVPLAGWPNEAAKDDVRFAIEYLGLNAKVGSNGKLDATSTKDLCNEMIRFGLSSVSELFITQIQDYLCLDSTSRTNVPGTLGSNWKWRLTGKELTKSLSKRMSRMAYIYGRNPEKV